MIMKNEKDETIEIKIEDLDAADDVGSTEVAIENKKETNDGGEDMTNENKTDVKTENETVNKQIVENFNSKEINNIRIEDDQMDLVFILDRSGSMYNAVNDTINGFNSFVERQLAKCHDIRVTTVLFDDEYEVLYSRKPIREVKPLDEETYYVRGCTALLDAVGKTVTRYEREIKNRTLCIINTDGLENASREFSRSQIKDMVETSGWEFIFIGADIDSYGEASRIGIKATHTANYCKTEEGIENLFADIDCATDAVFNKCCLDEIDWKKNLD